MSELDLDALQTVAKAASGPWEFRPRRGFQSMSENPATIGFVDTAGYFVVVREGAWATENDMSHIATFDPPTVLALLAEVAALRQQVAEAVDRTPAIDAAHIEHQRAWSTATFGPREVRGPRGPLAHARKELDEVEEDPSVLEEWVDVIILAFDGAWRAGHEPQAILDAVKAKQAKNETRRWPDWREVPEDEAIEHLRHLDPCPVGGFHAYRADTGRCACGAPGPDALEANDA